MAAFFLDSSALAKRYLEERGRLHVLQLLAAVPAPSCYVCRLTPVEIVAALSRRQRAGSVAATVAAQAVALLRQELRQRFKVIEINAPLIEEAMRLAEKHGLRAYDAVQLSAALEVQHGCTTLGLPPTTLVSADAELNAAALAEGLTVDNPNDHP